MTYQRMMTMWRFERREKKLQSKRSKMPKSGKGLGKMYVDVVTKQEKKRKAYERNR